MKLYYSPTSPYVRKVRVLMFERGLEAELIPANSRVPEQDEINPNPLGKIPALEIEDGTLLYDSRVICSYLDGVGDRPPFIPTDAGERLLTMRTDALANGLIDVAVGNVYEKLRPEEQQSPYWVDRREGQIGASLKTANELNLFNDATPDYGDLMMGVALDYLNFRHGHLNWGETYPELFSRHQAILKRASFKHTAPPTS